MFIITRLISSLEISADQIDESRPALTSLARLRSLPGELRNQIYEHLAEDDRIIVRDGDITSSYLSRLDCVDPEILLEYVSLAISTAQIEMRFNDVAVIHFEQFSRFLAREGIRILPTSRKTSSRRFTVKLNMKEWRPQESEIFNRWLGKLLRMDIYYVSVR